jgi:hypothetical protein
VAGNCDFLQVTDEEENGSVQIISSFFSFWYKLSHSDFNLLFFFIIFSTHFAEFLSCSLHFDDELTDGLKTTVKKKTGKLWCLKLLYFQHH